MLKFLMETLAARHVTLVAVSKTHPLEKIQALYDQGQRDFGENRVQELLPKYEALPKDIRWHLIGHLQTNKVRQVAPFVHLIHSVDSLKLLLEIDLQAKKIDRVVDCLLQFHIAREETKFGLDEQEARQLLESPEFAAMRHARIVGVMGMATNTLDLEHVRAEFDGLSAIFQRLKTAYFQEKPYFREVSMGMSSDWQVAVEAGSTLVRIGSLLFGQREG